MDYLDVTAPKKISKIGLGTAQFGSREWAYGEPYARREAHAIVDRAVELGITLFDTAEIYGEGRSERILVEALGDRRESVLVATKAFPVFPSATILRRQANASTRRLQLRHIDLYQVHWANPFISDRSLMRGMRRLQQRGLIDQVGVSGYPLDRWKAAEELLGAPILTNQVGYSLLERWAETDLLPFAATHDRAIIAYSPLAKGLLSAQYEGDRRPTEGTRASDPLFARDDRPIRRLMGTLRQVAANHSATPAQIALAWVIHHHNVVAIPGAATVQQLEDNAAAVDIRLDPDEHQALTSASSSIGSTAAPPIARPGLASLKHWARGAGYVARTAWRDLETHHPLIGLRRTGHPGGEGEARADDEKPAPT